MISSEKMTLITLEGPDKVGKSTIYQLLRRATEYGPLVVDRFIGSNWVYDQIYHRGTDLDAYFKAEDELSERFNTICFCLTCDKEVLSERILHLEKGLDKYQALTNFSKADQLFRVYLNLTGLKNTLLIDTSKVTPVEVVGQMINFMKEIGYETDRWYRNLSQLS